MKRDLTEKLEFGKYVCNKDPSIAEAIPCNSEENLYRKLRAIIKKYLRVANSGVKMYE